MKRKSHAEFLGGKGAERPLTYPIYTYNNDFNVSSFTYAGATFNYNYDNDGLLTGVGNFTITRDTYNGFPEAVSGGAFSLSRTFNGYGEVAAQATAVNSRDLTSWSLTRDNNGRITSKSEMVDGVISEYEYTYDAKGRLLTVTKDGGLVEEYQYDIAGSRTYEMNALRGIAARSYSYSDEDHLLTAGTVSYDYDLDGFLTTKTDGSEVTSYTYSSRGELLSVSLPDGRIIEYVHDPFGRRIAKKVDDVIVEKYLWQGLTRLLAVYDGADNLSMRFDYADVRLPVAMNVGEVTYYLAYDQVGSLRSISDSAGNVIKLVEYDSFGNIVSDSSLAFAVPFGFAGGLHDRHTGLVRFGFRDYDPEIGRWAAKDPIFFAGGDTDLYGYVLNNPVNLIDPLGLKYWQNVWSNFRDSNTVVPGLLAPAGGGLLTAGHTAEALGTTTLLRWAGSGYSGSTLSGAAFTGAETGILVDATSAMNFALFGLSWEVGLFTGSLVSAIPIGSDQTIGTYWGNYFYDAYSQSEFDFCSDYDVVFMLDIE